MAKKSRQRKSQVKRPTEAQATKTAFIAPATHKPWQIAVVCIVLAVVTLFVFQGVRHNGFLTYDDMDYVAENAHVHHGLNAESIHWAFTTFYVSNWHPLTWISHMVDWNLYGNNPAGHHLMNLCLHTANAVLLFLFFLYMTGLVGRSAMVAFLFALHPAHVESVAWLAERKDLLCAFFFFCTLLAYVWNLRKPSWKRYLLIICAYACALMSKPMAVTLPLTLLLLDYWPLRRITFAPETRNKWFSSLFKLCLEKWLLFIMAAASSVVTFIAQRSGGSVAELQSLPLFVRLCNVAIGYCRYLLLTFWPDPLTAYYYYDLNHTKVVAGVISSISLIVITAICWRIRIAKPYCLIGWLWFLGTFLPVIGFVQVGEQFMAERYTYIPLIGIFFAVVWLVGDAVTNSPKLKVATQLVAVALIIVCAAKSYAQVKIWKDNITLFSHALEIDPRGGLPNFNLGMAYERQGNLDAAREYVDRSLSYNSTKPLILSYSAFLMMRAAMQTHDQNLLPVAGQRLEQALQLAPNDTFALTNMALWDALMEKPKDEETYSRRVLAAQPNSIQARLYLADALQAQNELDESAQEYRNVLANAPNMSDAHNSLGIVEDKQGLKQEAIKEYQASLLIKPNQPAIHARIGRILTGMHRLPEAVEEFSQAVQLAPADANAHDDLGVALFQVGAYEKAAEQFNEALRIDPAYEGAKRNLDITLGNMKNRKVQPGKR